MLEAKLDEKRERITREMRPEYLDHLTLGQVLVTHMLDNFTGELLEHAQELFVQRIDEGERYIQRLFNRFVKTFFNNNLPGTQPEICAFTSYYEYLRFLWKERPAKRIDPQLAHLPPERAQAIEYYRGFDSEGKKAAQDGFSKGLQDIEVFLEAAYSTSVGRQAALILAGRKDTDRAVEKTADRLLRYEINSQRGKRGITKPVKVPIVDDWFRIKIVTYAPSDVTPLFREFYRRLGDYGLEPDSRQEVRERKDGSGEKGLQEPGVDDHYKYGGRDQLIQLKARPKGKNRLYEIVFTSVPDLLVDEREHVRFRQNQANELKRVLNTRRDYARRYDQFRKRGEQLHTLLDPHRSRILVPCSYFH